MVMLPDKSIIRAQFHASRRQLLVPQILTILALFQTTERALYRAVARRPWHEATVLAAVMAHLHRLMADISHLLPVAMEAQYAHGLGLGGDSRAMLPDDQVRAHRLTHELEATLLAGLLMVPQSLRAAIADAQRQARLAVAETGKDGKALPLPTAHDLLLASLVKTGFVAFVDTLRRPWSLRNYATMAAKSVAQTATNVGALFADTNHDLYMISASLNPCSLCAPLEGRIISRSGNDSRFPGLLDVFMDLIDEAGSADDLDNRWLGLHNNCQHYLQQINEADYFPDDWQALIDHSSLTFNPVTHDPRSEAQRAAYRQRARERMRAVREYRKLSTNKLSN